MAEAELIEQLRAQVMSLKSPRHSTPERTTLDSESTGSSSRGRITARTSGGISGRTSANTRVASLTGLENGEMPMGLDVGGVVYRTTQNTLKSVETSYFALLLNGMCDPIKTEDGHIFIDRNGELFGYVLEYLRGYVHHDMESVELPSEMKKLKALKREADFYRLPDFASLVQIAIQEQEGKSRDNDADSNSSVIVKDEEAVSETEFDVIFHSIASGQCHFTEDRIQELVGRVNYALSIKQADGFKIKSSSSDVVFDPTKNLPFIMFMHVTLCRDKPQGSHLFSPTERPKPAAPQFYNSTSIQQPHLNYDQMSSEGIEAMPTPRRRDLTPYSPKTDRSHYGARYMANTSPEVPSEITLSSLEYRPDGRRNHHQHQQHNKPRPRHVENIDWDSEAEYQLSPRAVPAYQPSPSAPAYHSSPSAQIKKHSSRKVHGRRAEAPSKDTNRLLTERPGRHAAWINHARAI